MPNHAFKCLKCGHQFEALVAPHTEKTPCLECGHEEARKLLSAPGIKFVGPGFYKTDSRKGPAGSTGSAAPGKKA